MKDISQPPKHPWDHAFRQGNPGGCGVGSGCATGASWKEGWGPWGQQKGIESRWAHAGRAARWCHVFARSEMWVGHMRFISTSAKQRTCFVSRSGLVWVGPSTSLGDQMRKSRSPGFPVMSFSPVLNFGDSTWPWALGQYFAILLKEYVDVWCVWICSI